jgi:hypothetical protein
MSLDEEAEPAGTRVDRTGCGKLGVLLSLPSLTPGDRPRLCGSSLVGFEEAKEGGQALGERRRRVVGFPSQADISDDPDISDDLDNHSDDVAGRH